MNLLAYSSMVLPKSINLLYITTIQTTCKSSPHAILNSLHSFTKLLALIPVVRLKRYKNTLNMVLYCPLWLIPHDFLKRFHIITLVKKQIILIIHKQFRNISSFIQWECFYEIMNMAKHHISSVVAKWFFPRPGFWKINTDGCSKGNPGLSGSGGILRNDRCLVVMAYGVLLGNNTIIWLRQKLWTLV